MVVSSWPTPRPPVSFDIGISTDKAAAGTKSYVTLDLGVRYATEVKTIRASLSPDEADRLADRLKKMAQLLRDEGS